MSSDYTDIFSAMGWSTSSSSSSSSTISLYDYHSIKSGTYYKVLKNYYAQQSAETSTETETKQKALTLTASNASSLYSSITSLMDESLYEGTVTTDDDGNETTEYDWDSIVSKVQSFIDDYNTLMESASESTSSKVSKNAEWLTSLTDTYSSLLESVGISVSGGQLSLDEDALKEANMSTIKFLFTGTNSYADKVAQKASTISSAATTAANSLSSTYTSSADYSTLLSSGLLYDSTS